jgi:dCMP deaminase
MFHDKWHFRFQELAMHISKWSKDPSTQVGAVIVNPDRVIVGTGYNGFARGVEDSEERLSSREEKYPRVIHAEINAILNANGSVKGCVLYTWPFPCCCPCSALVIQAGIKMVVSPASIPDRWKETVDMGIKMYREAAVRVRLL